MMFKLI